MRRLHAIAGSVALLAFLASGAYMRTHNPPVRDLEPAMHAMFTSRHIYILAAAIANLLMGAYVMPVSSRRARIAQWIGSALLVTAAALLISAFVYEPVSGRLRTAVSTRGVQALLAGTLVHVIAARAGGRRG